jgi:hypothetical protein
VTIATSAVLVAMPGSTSSALDTERPALVVGELPGRPVTSEHDKTVLVEDEYVDPANVRPVLGHRDCQPVGASGVATDRRRPCDEPSKANQPGGITMNEPNRRTRLFGAAVAIAAGAMVAPAAAHAEPQGYFPAELGVGYFYGTFDQSPNIQLLVGGRAEEFCLSNPDDPFNGEPGSAPLRVFERDDGSVDLKVNDKAQEIHLYELSDLVGPEWIVEVCADLFDEDPATTVPEPFASGTADLKVRISVVSDDLIDVFNSANGTATAADGTEYKVRASADLVVENGMPVGNPDDFVSFEMIEIRR